MSPPPTPSILDAVTAIVLVLDGRGFVVARNRHATEQLGSFGSLGEPFWMLFSPAEQPEVRAHVEAVITQHAPIHFERAITRDDAVRTYDWTLAAGTDVGEPVVVVTGIDLTRHRRELEKLTAAEQQLRALFDLIPDAVFFKDGQGRWMELNRAALELFALSTHEDYRGLSDVELAERSPPYRSALLICSETDRQAWERKAPNRSEEVIVGRDGVAQLYEVTKVPSFHPDGRRKGLIALGRDITLRKHAEQAREASDVRLREIVETVPDVILLMDEHGVITFANPAAQELFELPVSGIISRSLRDLGFEITTIDGEPLSPRDMPYARVLESGRPEHGIRLALHRPDGRWFALSVNAAPLSSPRNTIVVAGQDTTERTRIERAKDEFLRMAAHELRTPVTPLLLLLEQGRLDLDAGRALESSWLARIRRLMVRIKVMVEDMVTVARLDSMRFALNRERVDLRPLVAGIVEDLRLLAPTRRLLLTLPDEPVGAVVDQTRIEQVVYNLVDNALKYTRGDVEVRLTLEPLLVRVSVHDDGPSIPPEQQRSLFTRFHRVGTPATLPQSGLGLGLYICREIVARHGGAIGYQPAATGNTFFFTLLRDL